MLVGVMSGYHLLGPSGVIETMGMVVTVTLRSKFFKENSELHIIFVVSVLGLIVDSHKHRQHATDAKALEIYVSLLSLWEMRLI